VRNSGGHQGASKFGDLLHSGGHCVGLIRRGDSDRGIMFSGESESGDAPLAQVGVNTPVAEPSSSASGVLADTAVTTSTDIASDRLESSVDDGRLIAEVNWSGEGPSANAAAPRVSTNARSRNWLSSYLLALIALDLVAAVVADAVGYSVRFGSFNAADGEQASSWVVAACFPLAWVIVLAASRAYERKTLGSGSTEFERVIRGFFHATAVTAIVLCAMRLQASRGFILIALPSVLLLSLLGRQGGRSVLRRLRRQGRASMTILAVGEGPALAEFKQRLEADRAAGLRLVGYCRSDDSTDGELGLDGVAMTQGLDSIAESVRATRADAVAVVSSTIKAEKLRWIAWQLESAETKLFVAPGLTEVAGRRLHIQQVSGLPLLHVAQPTFGGVAKLVKGAFDRTVALLGLLLISPILLCIAALVRCTSRGPAFFCQTRVGKDGKTFRMVKFRTMVVDAESKLVELIDKNDSEGGMLFKIRNDPRVTRIGGVLRRYSFDELPQLINVVLGSMSLVGPRPPLPREADRYGDSHRRRLLVKPGLTGLWQISGRSDLSWEESVRLDLRYVENWSLSGDLAILAKTAVAVARSAGAY
jgi:exopolysaccharide biosynthesis polyprenyl glycosylphosphotransferase